MSNEDRTSRSVAANKLDALGLGGEKPKAEPAAPVRNAYASRSRGGLFDDMDDDLEIPEFLRRDKSTNGAPLQSKGKEPAPSQSAGSPRKHTGERTAQYAPHSYISGADGFKVGESLTLREAAVFSEAAATFITNRVHEAMADALEKYGLIWTSGVSRNVKAQIRDSITGCTFRKQEADGVSTSYVAVQVADNEIDRG